MLFYTLLGGYVLSSVLFFKYPMLIHKKKKIKFCCRHISHRGGAGESYENTMSAFKRAVAIGTEMLELDCHLTKDEEVVVSHDQNLLRSTGVNKNISEVNYKDLPLLKPCLPIDFDPEMEYVGSAKEEDRKFPLLKEVFEAFPQMPINIDIKVNDDRLISKVADLIEQYNREEYTVWGNFSKEVTEKCYKANPNINLLFSMQRVTLLLFLMYTGLLPFFPLKETHLEIFLPSIYLSFSEYLENLMDWKVDHGLVKVPRKFRNLLKKENPSIYSSSRDIHEMSTGKIDNYNEVYFWVLNREEEYERAFELGATGVMTDYPTKLKAFLRNKYELTS